MVAQVCLPTVISSLQNPFCLYIYIQKQIPKTTVRNSTSTFRIGTGTLDMYLQRGNCLCNKIHINTGRSLQVLYGTNGSRSIRAGLILFAAKPIQSYVRLLVPVPVPTRRELKICY